MREPGRMRIAGMGLAALLLAPFWGSALVANGGFRLFQQRDWPAAAQWWAAAAGAPGPNGEWARLTALATDRAGDPTEAARWAAQAVQDAAPGAPLALWQRGLIQHAQGQAAAALESWRQAGAAPYFCTQAARALYATTPPDPARAVDAATICTALDANAGDGWLVLGQAQAARGQDQAALAAFAPAYDRLLAAGQPGRAAVAAATAAGIAGRSGAGAAVVAGWLARARALTPTVCADPARPRDPNLDALCATP